MQQKRCRQASESPGEGRLMLTRTPRPLPWTAGRLPRDRRPPDVYRRMPDAGPEAPARGELARDAALAMIEAALLVADEPLTARKLAAVAGVKDGTEARRLVRKL